MKLRLIAVLASAVLMLCVSVPGVVRGVRAAAAAWLYLDSKYGDSRESMRVVLSNCATSYRFYPHNYNFAMWTASRAYEAALRENGAEREYLMNAAEFWCDTGLTMNPYKRQLRLLRARLMAADDPAAGAACWLEYLDWHYWEPENHLFMAEFHALAGDYDSAFASLEAIKGMSEYDMGREMVQRYWKREMELPSGF